MVRMMVGSSMTATTRRRPLHRGHSRTSASKVLHMSKAQSTRGVVATSAPQLVHARRSLRQKAAQFAFIGL